MYKLNVKYSRVPKLWLIISAAIFILAVGGVVALRTWYADNLKPVSLVQTTQYFTVDQGDSIRKIALNLKKAGLIRNVRAFETYVRSRELILQLQAGTYELSPSMSVQQIVKKI